MAFNLEIGIDGSGATRGAGTVNNALASISGRAKAAGGAVSGAEKNLQSLGSTARNITGALVALGTGFAVKEFIQLSDAFTTVNNRLRLVTSSAKELSSVQAELIRQSQQSFVGLSQQAETFSRVAKGAGQFGFTTRQALSATEALADAVRISGVSAEAANAALVQFGQGLASGALRGDELRSVLEQTPRLAQTLADALHLTVGELRMFGQEGKLTTDVIIPALLNEQKKLRAEAALMAPTIGQAFTNLKTTLEVAIGDFNEASGAAGTFGDGVRNLTELIPILVDGLAILLTQLGIVFSFGIDVAKGIGAAFGLVAGTFEDTTVSTGFLKQGLENLKTPISSSVAALKIFGVEILSFFVRVGIEIRGMFNDILIAATEVDIAVQNLFNINSSGSVTQLEKLHAAQAALSAEMKTTEDFRLDAINNIINEKTANDAKTTGLLAQIEAQRKLREAALANLDANTAGRAGKFAEDAALPGGAPDKAAEKAAKKLAEDVADFEAANNAALAYKQTLAEINRLAAAGADQKAVSNAITAAQEAFMAADPAARDFNERLDTAKQLFEDTRTPAENIVTQLRDLRALAADFPDIIDPETLQRATTAIEKQGTNFQLMEDLGMEAAKNIQNAFVDLFMSAGSGLDDFADQFGKTLQQMAANFLANQAIKFLLEAAGGAIGGTAGGAIAGMAASFAGGKAGGGAIPAGQFAVVGEKGPEIVSGPGMVTPNSQMMASPQVHVNIANVSNPRSAIEAATNTSAGQKGIVNTIGLNREAIRRELGIA